MSTDQALTTATRAAYAAIVSTRARGSFDNTPVYHAIATSGISPEDAATVTTEAVAMAFEIHKEGRV